MPVQPHFLEGGEMRDYQLHGLSWLISMYRNGVGAILGDEMVGIPDRPVTLAARVSDH